MPFASLRGRGPANLWQVMASLRARVGVIVIFSMGNLDWQMITSIPDKLSFARAYKKLNEAGIRVATVDHLISWAMYFDDPDGNGLEIYCDTRSEGDGSTLGCGINVGLPRERILGEFG